MWLAKTTPQTAACLFFQSLSQGKRWWTLLANFLLFVDCAFWASILSLVLGLKDFLLRCFPKLLLVFYFTFKFSVHYERFFIRLVGKWRGMRLTTQGPDTLTGLLSFPSHRCPQCFTHTRQPCGCHCPYCETSFSWFFPSTLIRRPPSLWFPHNIVPPLPQTKLSAPLSACPWDSCPPYCIQLSPYKM